MSKLGWSKRIRKRSTLRRFDNCPFVTGTCSPMSAQMHRSTKRRISAGAVLAGMGALLAAAPAMAFTSAEDFLRSYDRSFAADDIVSGVARVENVDRSDGTITLLHQSIASRDGSLAMQEMSMAFPVANPAWLHSLKPGDQVRFSAARRRGAITIIKIVPASSERHK